MAESRKLYRKLNGTGIHMVSGFSEGTTINGQSVTGRHVLRPGNTVYCYPSELGENHLDQFEVIGGRTDGPETDDTGPGQAPGTLEMRRRGNTGWYDIINPSNPDKPLNDKAMNREEAQEFLKELTQGDHPEPDKYDDMDWDELVQELEDFGITELDPEWETEDDLRRAIREIPDIE